MPVLLGAREIETSGLIQPGITGKHGEGEENAVSRFTRKKVSTTEYIHPDPIRITRHVTHATVTRNPDLTSNESLKDTARAYSFLRIRCVCVCKKTKQITFRYARPYAIRSNPVGESRRIRSCTNETVDGHSQWTSPSKAENVPYNNRPHQLPVSRAPKFYPSPDRPQ